MLVYTNVIINVFDTDNVQKITGMPVYIQSRSDRVATGYDSQGSFKEWIMMANNNVDILIHDRVEDSKGRVFWVKGAKLHSDLTGKHMRFSLTQEYD